MLKLHFTSLDDFEADYKQVIDAELNELALNHYWWNQPPRLDLDAKPLESLIGSCPLLRRILIKPNSEPVKIDYRDDMLLCMVDYLKCVEILTALSKEHEFAWELAQPGEPRPKPIGRIIDGEIEPRLFETLLPEIDALEISESELQDESLHAKIRASYPTPAS